VSCPLLFQRDEDDESLQTTPPHTPPSADTSNVLRKSSRIGPDKRSYEGMQSRYNGAGRPCKRFKYTVQEISGMLSDPADVADRNESAAERSMDNPTAVDGVRDTTDESPDSDPATNAPSEVIQELVNSTASAAPSTNSSLFDKPPSNDPTAETTTGTTAVSAGDHSNNTTTLYTAGGGAPASDPGAGCIATTGSPPPNELINTKRPVLDESSNSLEIVLEALKTQNTDPHSQLHGSRYVYRTHSPRPCGFCKNNYQYRDKLYREQLCDPGLYT
jgi:hypothetical protein